MMTFFQFLEIVNVLKLYIISTFKASLVHDILWCHILSKIVPDNGINDNENHSKL